MNNNLPMSPPVVIRDLPGIADLEVNLLMQRNAYEGVADDLSQKAALRLFGAWFIGENCELPDDMLTAWAMTDDETMNAMLTIGIDFSDSRGHPLRCTLHLAPTVEIAARGIAGRLPDQTQAEIDQMASKLERECVAFIDRKRRGR